MKQNVREEFHKLSSLQVQRNYEVLYIQAWLWGRCSEVHGELLCLLQDRLGALLPLGETEITKEVEESSVYPSLCAFAPPIYFLDLTEKLFRYSAEVGQNALKEGKGKRIQRFESQYWSSLFNSQTYRANSVAFM